MCFVCMCVYECLSFLTFRVSGHHCRCDYTRSRLLTRGRYNISFKIFISIYFSDNLLNLHVKSKSFIFTP